jgi:hypothetical protein
VAARAARGEAARGEAEAGGGRGVAGAGGVIRFQGASRLLRHFPPPWIRAETNDRHIVHVMF